MKLDFERLNRDIAYSAREREFEKLLKECEQQARAEEKQRIIKWAEDYMKAQWTECETGKHGIALEDLIKFLK